MTDVTSELTRPSPRQTLQVVMAFAGRGVLWGLLVVLVVGCLSGAPMIVWIGIVPGAAAGGITGAATGAGAALAARLAPLGTPRRSVFAAVGGGIGAAMIFTLASLWLWQAFEAVVAAAVGSILAAALAPFAMLRSDGVHREGGRDPWLVVGIVLSVLTLLACAFRSGGGGNVASIWPLFVVSVFAIPAAAALVVALVRRDRTGPNPRISESDGVWGVIALGLLVLGVAMPQGALAGAVGS